MSSNSPSDAITEAEILGTAAPASPKRNAFTTLMSTKRKTDTEGPAKASRETVSYFGRDGLGAYIQNPEKYDASRVIYFDDAFVAINDLYPKSSVHTLLLPRSKHHNLLHPFDAFRDAAFLTLVQQEALKLRKLVAKELQRKYGKFSVRDRAREAVLNGEVELPEGDASLPKGRDWEKEVKVGIHAHPSMNHLHVHVLSVDQYSECLKHRNHYNSFTTPFFVDVNDFPLTEDDVRKHPGREGYLQADMKCWRCGKNFGNKFVKLKDHLEEEFDAWKME